MQCDGTPINLVLSLTCGQIAAEMRDYVFRSKAITFRTMYSDDQRTVARLFGQLTCVQRMAEAEMLETLRRFVPTRFTMKCSAGAPSSGN